MGLEREWAIGRQLNLLDDPDGYLPGFMQTGSKVLDHEGQFLGMTLEKLNGGDVLDRFEDPLFNDVDYILNLIVQVRVCLSQSLRFLILLFVLALSSVRKVHSFRQTLVISGPAVGSEQIQIKIKRNSVD